MARLFVAAVVAVVVFFSAIDPDSMSEGSPLGDPWGMALIALPAAIVVVGIALVCGRYWWLRLLQALRLITTAWGWAALAGLIGAPIAGHAEMMPAMTAHLAASYVAHGALRRIVRILLNETARLADGSTG